MSKIGVCVIGLGRAGMIHAVNFVKNVPDAMLVAVVDPLEKVAKQACCTLGIDTYYTDYKLALEDKNVDAVVIVTPTKFHMDIAVNAAKAGKHILCEKPMAMTVEECRRMNAAAKEYNVILQIGFMRRFDAGFLRAKEIVDAGEIGDVVMVRSNTRGPSIPQPWMYDLQKSNGPLAEVNSHDIDTLRWFTGSEFSTIYAIGGNFRSPKAREAFPDFYDNVVVIANMANGMQGMMDGAQGVGYAYDSRVEVLGTKGCVFIGRVNDSAVFTCTANRRHGEYPLIDSWTKLFRDAYLAEDISFIDSIQNQSPPKVTGYDGEMAVKVVTAGNLSIIEKKIIHLDTV
jgi:myo-inositol 2-dehydrogenase/D-chiro-inositol 1-dehydrogenase/scyllo-inositol 2-dehydrogenase (NAD+)